MCNSRLMTSFFQREKYRLKNGARIMLVKKLIYICNCNFKRALKELMQIVVRLAKQFQNELEDPRGIGQSIMKSIEKANSVSIFKNHYSSPITFLNDNKPLGFFIIKHKTRIK